MFHIDPYLGQNSVRSGLELGQNLVRIWSRTWLELGQTKKLELGQNGGVWHQHQVRAGSIKYGCDMDMDMDMDVDMDMYSKSVGFHVNE